MTQSIVKMQLQMVATQDPRAYLKSPEFATTGFATKVLDLYRTGITPRPVEELRRAHESARNQFKEQLDAFCSLENGKWFQTCTYAIDSFVKFDGDYEGLDLSSTIFPCMRDAIDEITEGVYSDTHVKYNVSQETLALWISKDVMTSMMIAWIDLGDNLLWCPLLDRKMIIDHCLKASGCDAKAPSNNVVH